MTPAPPTQAKTSSTRWFVYVAIWFAVLVLFALQLDGTFSLTWLEALRHSFDQCLPWAVAAIPVIWLVRRFSPMQPRRMIRNLAMHVVISIFVALLAQYSFEALIRVANDNPPGPRRGPERAMQGERPGDRPGGPRPGDRLGEPPPRPGDRPGARPEGRPGAGPGDRPLRPPPDGEFEAGTRPDLDPRPPAPGEGPPPDFRRRVVRYLSRGIPIYWAILGLESLLLSLTTLRQKERESLVLKSEITSTRLQQLQYQLQPHFLFNTLNGISTLVHRSPIEADTAIGHLSTLLRSVLDHQDEALIPLHEELKLLKAYLEIARMRFPGKIEFVQKIEDDCLQCMVPLMLFQPLIENSLKHGFQKVGSGTVWMSGHRIGDSLVLRVEDNGSGPPTQEPKPADDPTRSSHGIGLSNIRTRLHTLFDPSRVTFELRPRMVSKEAGGTEPSGTIVDIQFPIQLAPSPESHQR